MPLTEDEKQKIADQIRSEVTEKYRKRADDLASGKKQRPMASTVDSEAERDAEVARLRLEVMDQFHKDHNFVRYVDSRGQERWLSPEEYDHMRNRRRRRRRPIYEPIWGNWFRRAMFMAGALVVAVLLGWFLAD